MCTCIAAGPGRDALAQVPIRQSPKSLRFRPRRDDNTTYFTASTWPERVLVLVLDMLKLRSALMRTSGPHWLINGRKSPKMEACRLLSVA